MKRLIIHFLAVLAPLSVCFPDGPNEKVGTVGALFLRIPVGAEAVAMGSAYTGIASNSNGAFWNPAALALVKGKYNAQFHYTDWLVGLSHQAAVLSVRLGDSFVIAFSEIILSSPDMEVTTTRRQGGTGETFSYRDVAVTISLAKMFTDKFSLGGSVKYIGQTVYILSSQGMAFDIGTWYKVGFRDFRLVMSMRNFGPDMRFGGTFFDTRRKGNALISEELSYDSYPLPLSISVGFAGSLYRGENFGVLMSVESYYPVEFSPRVNLGVKINYEGTLSLLFGYMSNYERESFSLGFSTDFRKFNFEYAYRPMDLFSAVNTFSLGYRF